MGSSGLKQDDHSVEAEPGRPSRSIVEGSEIATRRRLFGRRMVTVAAGIALAMTLAVPAQAAPVRSGTIIGGYFPFVVVLAPGPPAECSWNVDCLSWLASDCNPAMVGIDPGLHSSIVDVRKLAGSSTVREFRVLPKLLGVVGGSVAIQFWTRGCNQLTPYPIRPNNLTARFKIPKWTAWMTVASMDTISFSWELN